MKQKLLAAAGALLALGALLSGLPTVSAAGEAPVAENLELSTYRGVSIGGMLSATDPDGGALSFEITTSPVKGTIDLDADGHFVYTPADGKRGKDYFGYKAIDVDGNRSQEATVIIRIEKQKSKVVYSDTAGTDSAYAAARLAEDGIFVGECLAGDNELSTDKAVTRQEILAISMQVAGAEPLSDVKTTGFSDDAEIEVWARPYVSTALRDGVISGYSDGQTAATFDPDREISVMEAAVMLDRAIGLTDAVTTWYRYDAVLPTWALQSASNVSACGLLPYGCSFTDETLSRGSAAEMLCAALDVLENR